MDFEDVMHLLLSLPEKEKLKAVRTMLQDENITPQKKMFLSKLASQEAAKGFKDVAYEEGKVPTKRIDPEMSTKGFKHMLETRSTTDETLSHVQQVYGQPEEWIKKVRNREIPVEQRRENIEHLKSEYSESNLPLLKHLLSESFVTFKQLQEPRTYSKQLQHLENIIKMSDQIDVLRDEVNELQIFKRQQLLFNQAVVHEIEHQKDIIDGILVSIPQLSVKDRNEKLRLEISLIESEQDKLKYLMSHNLNKSEIATILGISRSTVKRRCKKYQINTID